VHRRRGVSARFGKDELGPRLDLGGELRGETSDDEGVGGREEDPAGACFGIVCGSSDGDCKSAIMSILHLQGTHYYPSCQRLYRQTSSAYSAISASLRQSSAVWTHFGSNEHRYPPLRLLPYLREEQ
jgi:hypothetical protein